MGGSPATRRLLRDRRGSGLILMIGVTGVCLVAACVTIDTAAVLIAHRGLAALADSTALAGAQQVDEQAYADRGAGGWLVLDQGQARTLALAHLSAAARAGSPVTVTDLATSPTTVRVSLAREIRPPLTGQWLPSVTVRADAAAGLLTAVD